MTEAAEGFEIHRADLVKLAYRMLGSISDAQDVVQEAYLRYHKANKDEIDNVRAYLSKIVSRLCLDELKTARRTRETYIGPWLPEPLITEMNAPGVSDISVALMLALERLSPLERAAFILHDIFDLSFEEVASALDKSVVSCRQLASRARKQVRNQRPRYDVSPEQGSRIAEAFYKASVSGDISKLSQILAQDVALVSDGGGRRQAALRPILGIDKICRFYLGLYKKLQRLPGSLGPTQLLQLVTINNMPGFISLGADGALQTTSLEVQDSKIYCIYVVRNPAKLTHLQEGVG